MQPLKLADIQEWLIDNRKKYQELKEQKFPSFDNPLYWTYNHLHDFIQYYQYKSQCDQALSELYMMHFNQFSQWTMKYEVLGSENLLMFEVNHIKWDEDVSIDKIKIHEGLYTERLPFANILCFCKVFQHLYWDNSIHEAELSEIEKEAITTGLKNIFDTNYIYKR